MKPSTAEILPIIGTALDGGFYAGHIRAGEQPFALIVAPKADGEPDNIAWNGSNKFVAGALSYCDGMANTLAMAEAGSKLAQWARSLLVAGFDDWYLPSQPWLKMGTLS